MPRRYGGLNLPTPLSHAFRGYLCSRCQFPERLVTAVVHRHPVWVWYRRAAPKIHSPASVQVRPCLWTWPNRDAGSDLQRVMLKATYSEKDGCWFWTVWNVSSQTVTLTSTCTCAFRRRVQPTVADCPCSSTTRTGAASTYVTSNINSVSTVHQPELTFTRMLMQNSAATANWVLSNMMAWWTVPVWVSPHRVSA